MKHSLGVFSYGSSLFGLSTQGSDHDYLIVYQPFKNELCSLHEPSMNIIIKKDNTDYVFVNIKNFVLNLLSGEQTIYFEIIHSRQCEGTVLEFLAKNSDKFYTYNTLRSYLGYMKRDLKYAKDSKRLYHAYRAFRSIEMILSDEGYTNEFSESDLNTMKAIRNNTYDNQRLSVDLKEQHDILRKTINNKLETGQLQRTVTTEFLEELNEYVIKNIGNNTLVFDFNIMLGYTE